MDAEKSHYLPSANWRSQWCNVVCVRMPEDEWGMCVGRVSGSESESLSPEHRYLKAGEDKRLSSSRE